MFKLCQEHSNYVNHIKNNIEKCPQANLITMISQIPFPKLISLDLANNLISSVHGLADLYAPELKEIRLCHNFITSVKNLRRGYWPKLAFLNLSTSFMMKNKIRYLITNI